MDPCLFVKGENIWEEKKTEGDMLPTSIGKK